MRFDNLQNPSPHAQSSRYQVVMVKGCWSGDWLLVDCGPEVSDDRHAVAHHKCEVTDNYQKSRVMILKSLMITTRLLLFIKQPLLSVGSLSVVVGRPLTAVNSAFTVERRLFMDDYLALGFRKRKLKLMKCSECSPQAVTNDSSLWSARNPSP